MECPKCGGGAFLSEEELVKILEGTEPLRMIAKAKYQCRACSEQFTRLICDTLEGRHKLPERPALAYQQESHNYASYQQPAQTQPITWKKQEEEDAAAEGIKFLDNI